MSELKPRIHDEQTGLANLNEQAQNRHRRIVRQGRWLRPRA